MTTRMMRRLATTLALLELFGSSSKAEEPRVSAPLNPSTVPVASAFGVLGNGGIGVIVPHGDVTYIGGNFDELAALTGAFARLDAATGKHIAPLDEAQHGEVRASVPDGRGGYYIGGTFTSVGRESRARLAHILPGGSVDPDFNPGVPEQDSAVNALALSEDGSILYVGGGFDFIGSQTRHNLAAVETATGSVTAFNPAGVGTDGQVFALEVSGSQVYVGGQFEKLGGQPRNGLAKVQGTTGGDLGWVPNPTFNAGGGLIFAIEAAGDSVYVGGIFTAIGGQSRTHLAQLSASTGAALPGFAPNPDDVVWSIVRSGTSLYVGGDFNNIASVARPGLVRLDATTGALASFDAGLPTTDVVLAIAPSGADLFLGGFLTSVGGQPRTALAKVDAMTGALRAFDAGVGDFNAASVKTLAVDEAGVYAGGDFTFVNRITRHGIAALDRDGVPTAFNPDAGPGGPNTFNDVHAIAVTDSGIYLGGNFTTMAGQPRNRIAKVSASGELDPTFNPNATGGTIPGIDAIVVTSTDVYVGGDFSSIGGQPRIDLARLNPVTGQVDGGRESFDPDPLNGIEISRVRTLAVEGDAVYVGGDFTTIGGQARNKIAKISGATGDADVQFNANISGGSSVGPGVFDIVLAQATLYVVGDFSSIGGAARNNVATLNPLTGAEVTGFNPNVTGGTRPQVFEIIVTDDEVYIGGSFTSVGGQAQGQIARLTKTGVLSPFDPKIRDQPGAVIALGLSDSALHLGGIFFEMDGRPRKGYAQFREFDAADADGDALPDSWETQYGLPAGSSGPGGSAGDPDNDGRTNLQELGDGTHPRGFHTRYFAEGATIGFFDEHLALLNVSDSPARVLLRFQKGNGENVSHFMDVGGLTRATVRIKDLPGLEEAEFSNVIESDEEVVADRTMTWDATGYGSHAETSIAAPATTWYLAEGATHSGFDLFYLIQNPHAQTMHVHVKYLLPFDPPIEKDYEVNPSSRFNIWVDNDDPRLANTDVSAVITTDLPSIVERAMYLSSPEKLFNAGHESAGVTTPATEWFLAEGATGSFFDLFVLIANPSPTDAEVTVTFLLPDGSSFQQEHRVAADTRYNLWVDTLDPRLEDTAVSIVLNSTNGVPIVVERSMWWPGPTAATWAEAHNSAGLTSTGGTWALAEGEVGGARSVETYILIANRGPADTARVTLLYEDGTSESADFALPATSRTNVAVAVEFPNSVGRRFGAVVEALGAGAQIAVERAMYSNAAGAVWAAGTNAVGTKLQ